MAHSASYSTGWDADECSCERCRGPHLTAIDEAPAARPADRSRSEEADRGRGGPDGEQPLHPTFAG